MGNLSFREKKPSSILILGLYDSGKSSLLDHFKVGVQTTIPTIGFHVESVQHKNTILQSWDVGGRDKVRPLYRHYYIGTDCLIFVVDSTDEDRLPGVRSALMELVSEPELQDLPLAVAFNKWDLPHMPQEKLREELGITEIGKTRPCQSFVTSLVTDSSSQLDDMFEWVEYKINERRGQTDNGSQPLNNRSPFMHRTISKLKSLLLR